MLAEPKPRLIRKAQTRKHQTRVTKFMKYRPDASTFPLEPLGHY